MAEFIQYYLPVFNGHPVLAVAFGILAFAELAAACKGPGWFAVMILVVLVLL